MAEIHKHKPGREKLTQTRAELAGLEQESQEQKLLEQKKILSVSLMF